jgi:hypothetical protein
MMPQPAEVERGRVGKQQQGESHFGDAFHPSGRSWNIDEAEHVGAG